MTRYRRWNELLELLAVAGQLQVEEAAKALGVSEATVRRDLDELARLNVRAEADEQVGQAVPRLLPAQTCHCP